MSRLRVLAGLVGLTMAGLLITPTAALASTPLTATITCDAGTVTTRVSGTLLAPGTAPTQVTVEFQRQSGTRVSATTSAPLPPLAQPFRVTTTTSSSGELSTTGYTAAFDPATTLYYREKLLVTFTNAATGAFYTTRTATCDYDQRTTATLTCDPLAGTVTATVAGVNGQAGTAQGAGRPTRIGYRIVRISQSTKDVPPFRSQPLGEAWDVEHRLSRAADGTWSDTGYVHTITSHPYYYGEEVTVGVFDAYGAFVGGGSARCTLFDGSALPAS